MRKFKKVTAVLLTIVLIYSIFTTLQVNVAAAKIETEEVGASNPYDPYATWNGAWANCTYWAWQYAYDYDGISLPAWGDAKDWYSGASGTYRCDKTPSAHSIMCTGSGTHGHVAYVTDYNSSTGKVYIKQGGTRNTSDGRSEGEISAFPGDLQGYIHLGDSNTHYGAEIINFDGIDVSNISFFDATIGGWMRNPNSYNIRSYGFYFGINQNALSQYTIGQNVKWTDAYVQANLSNYVGRLSQGVTYYYRFFSLTDGYNLSPVYSFTTLGNSTVTFDNISTSNVNNENMSIECWARNHQGLNILKYGFYYGTAINEMNECIEVGNNVSWTDFHISVKMIEQNVDLKPNTTYYYQFFALTDGWNFSLVNSFTTGDYVPIKYSGFDVNFWVDGKDQVNIDRIGEVQVYVNGQLQGYGTDFCKNVPAGKPYEVKINISNPDFRFAGVDTSDASYSRLTGTTGDNETKVRLVICKDSGGVTDIPSGNYVIASAIDTKYGLDIAGDNLPANNNDNVILYPIGDAFRPQDIFTITNLGNGYYSIKQMETDMALDVAGAGVNNSANIQMFTGNGNDNQQWKISYDSSIDSYTIQSKCSGMYMTVESGSMEAGKNIYQNTKDNSIPKSQGWVLLPYKSAESTIIGDTNLDGHITISDVTAIQRHLAELDIFTDGQLALADTNGDGEINITDATHLQKYLAEFDGIVLGKS